MKKIGGAKMRAMQPTGGGKAMKTVAPKMETGDKPRSVKGILSKGQPVGSMVRLKPSSGRY